MARTEYILKTYGNYSKVRDEKNLTDYKVSQETGIATATLSSWKTGKYMPKADKLFTISSFLGIPMETIVSSK